MTESSQIYRIKAKIKQRLTLEKDYITYDTDPDRALGSIDALEYMLNYIDSVINEDTQKKQSLKLNCFYLTNGGFLAYTRSQTSDGLFIVDFFNDKF